MQSVEEQIRILIKTNRIGALYVLGGNNSDDNNNNDISYFISYE